MRLIEGDAERRECGDFDIDSDVCCLREGVIDVIRERMRVGDGSGSWASFWADGEDIYIDVVRIVRIDPAIEGVRERFAGTPDVDNDGSKRGKLCTGADMRLLFPDSDGIELDRRFALTDGTGTGVPLEGGADGGGILLLVRMVVLPLARVVADAVEEVRGLEILVDDIEEFKLDERFEKRAEDSEGRLEAI